jgi:hypothetical protein
VRLNPAADIGEDEFSWWAGDFPFSQGISDELAKGYLPLPSRRLRLAILLYLSARCLTWIALV